MIVFLEAIIIGILFLQQPLKLINHQNDTCEIAINHMRYRREIRENEWKSTDLSSTLYLPIYAQISDKSLKAICEAHSKRRKKHKWKHAKNIKSYSHRPKSLKKRDCGPINSISQPHILARRLNKIGGIVRYGTRWFQTEYSLGYNVFEYCNLTDLRSSHPSAVHSLDIAQFDGTDNTACNGSNFIYYASSTSHIYSYQIDEKLSKSAAIGASKIPIYKFSHSYLDLENDGGHLWILYHSIPDGILKASLRDCISLAEQKSWILQFLDTKTIVNAFIACNHLYTVTQNITSNILNIIYDFGTDKFFDNTPQIGSWKRHGIPSSVQYDHATRTINIFDNGIIYSIAVQMQ
ncbi:Olfactomedin-like domain family protein [Acanthocheilonema viteae]